MNKVQLDELMSLCKRRGFFYQGSEIYGGLAGTWDYGPLGVQLKRNLVELWWRHFVEKRSDMYGLDSAVLMNSRVWKASGHLDGFVDLVVEDSVTGERHRLDHLLEAAGVESDALDEKTGADLIKQHRLKSPAGNPISPAVGQFNMMFETRIGASSQAAQTAYLRPETAQGIFVNFRNVVDSCQPDMPFGIAQIGKSFRNEISPRDFLFRTREFEQMEIEYFCRQQNWSGVFDDWQAQLRDWAGMIGLDRKSLIEREVPESERAHYSQRTVDFDFRFAFGCKELWGLAYRGDYDLRQHQESSGKSLEYTDKQTRERFLPVCIEPSFGVERMILAILHSAYRWDEANRRAYLSLPAEIAPCRYAVSPLLSNQPQMVDRARQIFDGLQAKYGRVAWDDHGNIGKRYRRQDEIGTPWCIVIDHQTLEDGTVTRRNRDDLKQVRLQPDQL